MPLVRLSLSMVGTTAPVHLPRDDHTLAERIRSGDERAFEAVFWAHYEPLCRFAIAYVGTSDAAEDIVQDVFLHVWDGRQRLEVREDLKTYLFGATRNRALDYLRHQAVVQRAQQHATPDREVMLRLVQAPEPVDDALEREELDAAIRRAIDRLPRRCRQTFMLSREEGMSYAQVAAAMGVSVKTVKIQMGRALKAIRAAAAPFLVAAFLVAYH